MNTELPGQRARLLKEHLAYCEHNYQLWCYLFANSDHGQGWLNASQLGSVHYQAVDNTKFTQTYWLRLEPHLDKAQTAWLTLCLPVRIYHDMRVAEVLADQTGRQYPGINPYPNDRMWLPDEKVRLNAHLNLWLRACCCADNMHHNLCQSP